MKNRFYYLYRVIKYNAVYSVLLWSWFLCTITYPIWSTVWVITGFDVRKAIECLMDEKEEDFAIWRFLNV